MACLDLTNGGDSAKRWHRQVYDCDVGSATGYDVDNVFDVGRRVGHVKLLAPLAVEQQRQSLGEELVVVNDDNNVRPAPHCPDTTPSLVTSR